MKEPLLASFRGADFGGPEADYASYQVRQAARAVVFDGNRVALIHVSNRGYYMLPGGGIATGENYASAIARELQEELGCEVRIRQPIGTTETYIDRWRNRQIDTCCIADVATAIVRRSLTKFENQEGHKVVWAASLPEAIMLMEGARPVVLDGRLIRARDILFLQTAQAILSGCQVQQRQF